jgi:hypothetical protein
MRGRSSSGRGWGGERARSGGVSGGDGGGLGVGVVGRGGGVGGGGSVLEIDELGSGRLAREPFGCSQGWLGGEGWGEDVAERERGLETGDEASGKGEDEKKSDPIPIRLLMDPKSKTR